MQKKSLPETFPKPADLVSMDHTSLMALWRRSLTMDDVSDPREVGLKELAEYFNILGEEVREHCVHYQDDLLKEWQAKDRSNSEGLLDFYRTQISWIFDTMWYHANQFYEKKFPESVEIAFALKDLKPVQHLDFGAGPGSSSLFFYNLGWKVSLANVSTTMLEFARWRFNQHKVPANFYDSSSEPLPHEKFDLIKAIDVMVHIPDIPEKLGKLNQSLNKGGHLVFNIDSRPPTLDNHSHLYTHYFPIIRQVCRQGFRHLKRFNFLSV